MPDYVSFFESIQAHRSPHFDYALNLNSRPGVCSSVGAGSRKYRIGIAIQTMHDIYPFLQIHSFGGDKNQVTIWGGSAGEHQPCILLTWVANTASSG